ncbi:MAG: hypothetical protein P1P81_00385 [Desulfobulbales bacterium]|nr:hypothetical protein [Desulfobulbales bacterium]
MKINENIPVPALPCAAVGLVPQRPPMLVIERLVKRDRLANFSLVEATAPTEGFFVGQDGAVLPEYFIELVAQAMAAVNSFDGLVDGEKPGRGLLVGIENFSWPGRGEAGQKLRVEIVKNFDFGPVSVMAGTVFNKRGELLAGGEIKAWEEK